MIEDLLDDRQLQTALSERELEWCIEAKMSDGLSWEDAERECKQIQSEGREYAEQGPKFPASDSLGIVSREATPLERCMSSRMDVHGEDETTARKTCSKMFNDPLYKHVFEEGDAWKIGEALHKWEYNYSPKYRSFRERDAREAKRRDEKINEIIREIQRDRNDPDWILPATSLVERATRIFEGREEQRKVKAAREDRQSRLTVGDLHGKSKIQILTGQQGDQRDYGKSRGEILAEIKVQTDEENKLRKLRRRDKLE